MRIAVLGLGYVGCVSAACFAREGFHVVGVDVNEEKVAILNAGRSPIVEPGLDDLIAEVTRDGRLTATTDVREAVLSADISLVCVGTPSEKNGNIKLDYIFRVAEQVGQALRDSGRYHVFVIRSTVLPGTNEKARAILAEQSGKRPGVDFGTCSNPEFLREGTALHDFVRPPFTVIGESDSRSGDYVQQLYRGVDAPLVRTQVKVAELLKYACNSFHALKVVFGNEIGAICKQEGVDSHALMDIFCMDDKLNLSSYYLKPGFAFGGSCLPKDVRALTYRAKEKDVEVPLLASLMPSNRVHVQRALDLILSKGKNRIGVLGLSFKGDTDDLRESPMVDVVEALIGKGYDVRIYDPNVNLARLFGANREYINDRIPHISRLMVQSMRAVTDHAEVLVVGNRNKEFGGVLSPDHAGASVVDLVHAIGKGAGTPPSYDGLCW